MAHSITLIDSEDGIMNDLIVVGFHGKHRAAEVLDELENMAADWSIELKMRLSM